MSARQDSNLGPSPFRQRRIRLRRKEDSVSVRPPGLEPGTISFPPEADPPSAERG